jgi:cell division transport system permease protein
MATHHKRQARRVKSRRGASPKIRAIENGFVARPGPRSRLNVYFSHHLWVAISTLGNLWRSPLSTLMTSSVIAIALALPTGLFVLLQNVQQLSSSWENSAQISVFIKSDQSEDQIQELQGRLSHWPEIKTVQYISPQQAMAEFRQSSGFGDALAILDKNPLPAVLVIQPAMELSQSKALQALKVKLSHLPQVDQTQLDMQWVLRLGAIIHTGKRAVFILGVLLFVAILLVIGNTIRLTIFNKRQEIIVTKLIGATNQFIRRPFLYTGFWYGLFGACLAWVLVMVLMGSIKAPVDELAALYDSRFAIRTLDGHTSLQLFAAGSLLGLLGSWVAVGRHLKTIEPK